MLMICKALLFFLNCKSDPFFQRRSSTVLVFTMLFTVSTQKQQDAKLQMRGSCNKEVYLVSLFLIPPLILLCPTFSLVTLCSFAFNSTFQVLINIPKNGYFPLSIEPSICILLCGLPTDFRVSSWKVIKRSYHSLLNGSI